jgi:hypothetical protein
LGGTGHSVILAALLKILGSMTRFGPPYAIVASRARGR